MKRLLILSLLMILSSFAFAQDGTGTRSTVILNNGKRITGVVSKDSDNTFSIVANDGSISYYSAYDVQKIEPIIERKVAEHKKGFCKIGPTVLFEIGMGRMDGALTGEIFSMSMGGDISENVFIGIKAGIYPSKGTYYHPSDETKGQTDWSYAPAIDFRWSVSDAAVTPYLALALGSALTNTTNVDSDYDRYNYWWFSSHYEISGGVRFRYGKTQYSSKSLWAGASIAGYAEKTGILFKAAISF